MALGGRGMVITNKRGKTAFAIARKEAKHYKARA